MSTLEVDRLLVCVVVNGSILGKIFKKLYASYPCHQIRDQLLIQYFYEVLLPKDRSMIDATSGKALVDKTYEDASNLISNMATNL